MQVSWSPIASWISTAATAQSTPPDSPQMTRALPTWARIFATSLERKCAMVQSPGRPRDLVHEVGEQLGAVGRVHDLGVEHGRVDAARLVGGDGERRVLARRLDGEALGQPRDAVAVAHPHRVALADLPDAVEQRALLA